MSLGIHPLTSERWPDLEKLFGPRGACGGCWCMYYRKSAKGFKQDVGQTNRLEFKALVDSCSIPPGLIGYLNGEPVAWIAIAPRSDYPRLANSRILAPVDEQPVWSISCLFVDRKHRKSGLSSLMVQAATDFAFEQGASIVEGYPHDLKGETQPAPFVWTGLLGSFLKAGYSEVARRSPKRPIMRKGKRE